MATGETDGIFGDTGLSAGTTYAYQVRASEGVATQQYAQFAAFYASTTGGVVANLDAVAPVSCWGTRAGSDVRVTWTAANNDNADAYVIERRRNGGAWFWAGRVNAGREFLNTGLGNGTYEYRVFARATNGTTATRVCGPAGGVTIGAAGGGGANANAVGLQSCWGTRVGSDIRVTWTASNNDNAARYVIERRRNGGAWFWAGRVGPADRQFLNTNLNSGTYEYRVVVAAANGTTATRTCGPNGGVTIG